MVAGSVHTIPSGHARQLVFPRGEYMPVGHIWPIILSEHMFPAGHGSHDVAPAWLMYPMGQAYMKQTGIQTANMVP